MRVLGIPFAEKLVPFGGGTEGFRSFSPNSKVPCLVDEGTVVWDSLAIVEYLAERHRGVWTEDAELRAWSRLVSAEMHSGFGALRNAFTMNLGLRIRPRSIQEHLQRDLSRIDEIWGEGLSRSGGEFLAGPLFTAVDAFFCPVVAFRFMTYDPPLSELSAAYAEWLRRLPQMREWYEAAIAETWRDDEHEEEARTAGDWLQDLRNAGRDGA